MLTINKITKTFAKNSPHAHKALDELTLTVNNGDFITIIGSNGAGKSTLFNAICGDFFVDHGKISLNDRDITYLSTHKRARFIGRLFQDPLRGTAPNLTIEENLALSYTASRIKPLQFSLNKKNRQLFQERLSHFNMGLENRLDTKVGMLSGGQRQAVTLLMSTLLLPEILLLDEHTAALDPVSAENVMQITEDIVSENHLTTLMITHNLESALRMGTRTIMMDNGTVILDIAGTEREKMTQEDVMQYYKNANVMLADRMLLTR